MSTAAETDAQASIDLALPQVLEVDHVVLCAGQDPLTELMPSADAVQAPGAPRFHTIGGAALASELDAKRAIREGAVLAASL